MERIVGDDIDEYLNRNPQDAGSVFTQIIDGFAYLENADILHRDIRPQAILAPWQSANPEHNKRWRFVPIAQSMRT